MKAVLFYFQRGPLRAGGWWGDCQPPHQRLFKLVDHFFRDDKCYVNDLFFLVEDLTSASIRRD